MPRVIGSSGQKYTPTPVPLQIYRQNTILENDNTPSSTPSRIEQNSKRPRTKTNKDLKEIPSKAKWSGKTKIILGVIIACVVIAIIIAAILLGVLLSRKSDTTTSSSTTATTVITASWLFDANTNDYYSIYNGSGVNSPSYFSTSSTQPFVGYGRGLSLSSSSSQYVTVASPFLDLTYRSFTIEMWLYPTISSTVDFGIFGQCQCSTCSNQCLYLIIRNYHLYISFTNNDLSGNATLTTNTWYHIAFVYNNSTRQQILYINGVQDTIKSSSNSYQGTSGPMWIGAAQVYLTASHFNGYIDNFKITTRAKSSTEILNAATFIAYFSFDLPNSAYDSGPNGLNGTITNAVLVSGRVNQALRFSGSSSYFQAYGFYQMGYAVTTTKPFSVSLWISPSAAISCTIVQISPYLSPSNCHNLIGLFTYLGITTQIMVQGYAWPILYGPMATLNAWTHITLTYSLTNGLTLYVNGILIGYTGGFTFGASGAISYLQIGYYTSCSSGYMSNTAYQGSVDEVYVYSRDLVQSEVSALANP